MSTEILSFPLTKEQYYTFQLDLGIKLAETHGIHPVFNEDSEQVTYEIFLDGLKELVEWIKGTPANIGELCEIINKAERYSAPLSLVETIWGREFTDERIFDLALAIKTNTLHKI